MGAATSSRLLLPASGRRIAERSRLHTTFHAAACHLEILGWKQVYFTVWHYRRLVQVWREIRPVVKPALKDAALFFVVGAVLGFVAAAVGTFILPG